MRPCTTNKNDVHPAKTQSESLLHTLWVAKDPKFLWADSEDSDQTARADAQADLRLCWVHISFCWFCRAPAQTIFYSLIKQKALPYPKLLNNTKWLQNIEIFVYLPTFCLKVIFRLLNCNAPGPGRFLK